MALILVGSYMIRYPLGGALSWPLQWIYGLRQLGHDVYLVEKSVGWDCYDPAYDTMGHNASAGLRIVSELFQRFGLEGRFAFEDSAGVYHGKTEPETRDLFRSADLFIDIGTHGAFKDLASQTRRRVLVDGEPGYNQMRIALEQASGKPLAHYDGYYTHGVLLSQRHPEVPDCGVSWNTVLNPIALDLFPYSDPPKNGAFTTVMNWQAHAPLEYEGRSYGQKDVEFPKFMGLPRRVGAPMEVAVAGTKAPREELSANGWRLRSAQEVTATFDSYRDYIRTSLGEFSVAKNVFVALRSGWFSDRSNCYLSSGRPVVLQETGFSEHLPCGEGLFAVNNEEEAAAAIGEVLSDPVKHARRAREIAAGFLSTDVILTRFLHENGI